MLKKIRRIFFKTLFFLLLLAISAGLILTGLYFMKLSDEQYVFGEMVDQVFQKAKDIVSVDSSYNLGDTFQVEGTLKMNLSSEEYQNKSKTDPEFLKKNHILNNLSKMDVTYTIQQDRKNQQLYTEWNGKIGEEEIFSENHFISNSTQYFFVNKILSNYVNDGNNNYYETFTEETTTIDNISYLYDFIRDSIKKNVTKAQLKSYDQETVVGNDKINVGLISYRITDKEYKRLLKAVLNDIKSDQRATQILSASCYNIDNLKVNTKKKYLDPKASYTLNIYISKPFLKIVKYEWIYLKGDQKNIYSLEGNLDKGKFYYSENTNLKYSAEYQSTSRRMSIIVFDRNETQIGTIKGEKDKNGMMFTTTLDLEDDNYDIAYSSKYNDVKKTSYVREDSLTWKWTKDKTVQTEGNIEVVLNVSADPKITVDTDSSVLRSTLTETENEQLETRKDKIKERLEK